MSAATGLKVVGYFDCPGGGQVVVRDGVAYVGHVKPPNGTTLIDVSDPANPRKLAEITVPEGTLSHKVRVENGIMLVNREIFPIGRKDPDFRGGLEVFDVGKPSAPRHIATLADPRHAPVHVRRPLRLRLAGDRWLSRQRRRRSSTSRSRTAREEVGRWWMPGQWTAGGERPTWEGTDHRCHHPMRVGNRLYVSYWHGGFVILDIEDMTKPKFISGLDWSPPFPWPTHTALPVPFLLRGRRIMLVADEDVVRLGSRRRRHSSGSWISPTRRVRSRSPASRSTRKMACPNADYTGLHQFCEEIRSTEIPIAWFAHGLKHRRYRQSARATARSPPSCRRCPRGPSACRATTSVSMTGD